MKNKKLIYIEAIYNLLDDATLEIDTLIAEHDDGEKSNVSEARELATNTIDHYIDQLKEMKIKVHNLTFTEFIDFYNLGGDDEN